MHIWTMNKWKLNINGNVYRRIGIRFRYDKSVDLDYDYSKLEKINDRYKFTINNYIKGLIK